MKAAKNLNTKEIRKENPQNEPAPRSFRHFLHRYKWLLCAVCLLLCVAIAGGALLAYRGDWRYRLGLRFRHYSAPELTVQPPTDGQLELPLEDLLSDPRVTVTSDLLLINGDNAIPEGFAPVLTEDGGIPMAEAALIAFRQMNLAVQAETGTRLYVRSAWRSAEEQQKEWEQGGAQKIASKPGHSEHETGMALDVCVAGYGGMAFLKTAAGRMTNDTCGNYGFIIRYPDGKQSETGAVYEPWHLRYVGAPHASIIMNSGITLEKYLELLIPDTWYQSGDYSILRTAANSIPVPAEFTSCIASQDNLGYWIFTFV